MKINNFNAKWKFWEVTNSFSLNWNPPEDAREVNLPHDAMIEIPQDVNCKCGSKTGYRRGGVYSYSKTFYAESADRTYVLKIEGAYMNSFVYVNGQLAAKRPYGYSVYYVYLNDFLKYGQENEIRIQVRSGAEPNSRWYSGTGLYRDVYLLEAGKEYIVPDSIRVKTLSIPGDSTGCAQVSVTATVNGRDIPKTIEFIVTDQEENVVSFAETEICDGKTNVVLNIDKAHLWSSETPYLYKVNVRMLDGEKHEIDACFEQFGIRTLDLEAGKGLSVNGKSVLLRGACIHHDSGLLGSRTFDGVHERQIRILKEAGFNAIRSAHNPAAPALLRACDKVGMYVMDEAFDMWTRHKSDYDYAMVFDEWWERDIEAMVSNDYNHPSVIMYSVGNEIPETCNPQGVKICKQLCNKIRELDDSRYVLNSINGVFSAGERLGEMVADIVSNQDSQSKKDENVNDFMAMMSAHMDELVAHPIMDEVISEPLKYTDIAGYNYMGNRFEIDAENHPDRIMVGSETCIRDIAKDWSTVEKLPNVIGDFCWTGWDYLGEAGIGTPVYNSFKGGLGDSAFPAQIGGPGCIDITGYRLPMSYLREIIFGLRKDPYIAVNDPAHYGEYLITNPWLISDAIGSWSWRKYTGKNVCIEVYSDSEEVELFKGEVSLGRKKAGKNEGFITRFETTVDSLPLTAVSYSGNEETGRYEAACADEDVTVRAEESYSFEKDEYEIKYYDVLICDEKGIVAVDTDILVELKLEGSIELLGFGSADPKPLFNYNELKTKTYRGRAQLIIKKEKNKEAAFTVSSEFGECKVLA